MVEVFKFINVQSGSGKTERPLFFRKSFKVYDKDEIEKWKEELEKFNIPRNYSNTVKDGEINVFLERMSFDLILKIVNTGFGMKLYENKNFKFIVIMNSGNREVELNFQNTIEKIRSRNGIGYEEYILCGK